MKRNDAVCTGFELKHIFSFSVQISFLLDSQWQQWYGTCRILMWKVFLCVVNRISSLVMCFVRKHGRQVKWKTRMKSPQHSRRFTIKTKYSALRSIRTFLFRSRNFTDIRKASKVSVRFLIYILLTLLSRVAFRPSFMVMFKPPISPVRLCEKFFEVFKFYSYCKDLRIVKKSLPGKFPQNHASNFRSRKLSEQTASSFRWWSEIFLCGTVQRFAHYIRELINIERKDTTGWTPNVAQYRTRVYASIKFQGMLNESGKMET